MTSDAVRETLRVRRLLFAAAVGIGLWFALGPITGIAVARDDVGEPWPASWGVPERLPGDGGSYRPKDDPESVLEGFDFEWLGPRYSLQADGSLGKVWEFRVRNPTDESSPLVHQHQVFRVDDGGVLLAGGPERRDELFSSCPGLTVLCTTHKKSITRTYDHGEDARGAIPCGLLHTFQGTTRSLHGEFVFSEDCDGVVGDLVGDVTDVTRDVHGKRLSRIVLHRTESVEPSLAMVLREDLPYPLLIDPDAETDGPVLELADFRRGSPVNALALVGNPRDPGPFELVPRGRWGPNEAELDHLFPLETAMQQASDFEPRLRVYLVAHPDAYVANSEYHLSQASRSASEHLWNVTLTDGPTNMRLRVRMTVDTLSEEIHVELLPPIDQRFPTPDLVPATMPTASHLMWRWAAYYGYWGASVIDDTAPGSSATVWGGDVEPPGGYGVMIRCADPTCAKAMVEYHGCQDYQITRQMTDPNRRQVRDDFLRMDCQVVFDETGHPTTSREDYFSDALVRGEPDPQPYEAQGEMTPVAVAPAIATRPGRVLIGAGLASAFAAVLYWLWPLIRSSLTLSLFTRIQGPKVLENRTRADLFSLIEAEPGVHVRELRRRLGRAHGTVIHHLRMLETNGLIVARRGSGRTCYFPSNVHAATRNRPLVNSAQRIALLRLVANKPNASLSDIARGLQLTRQSVHESAQRLRRDGLVEVSESGRKRTVTLTGLGQEVLGPAPTDP